ncbi:hypothetical protein DCAR_0102153 [Daucus carota subsp. sativus]|uniref:Uncharacterized protein n=1 Tax=Daucus carota subsp. sativus TaxID=79200 RepID=A0AAF1AK13_DAUCS|nr:PREDICTED: uncharacterized protein LOC108227767 [Daucus carota subsp. sativus]WOG82980.1 hypothetical protein DCAR_0102153 [Daucus carota subsp. sativus]
MLRTFCSRVITVRGRIEFQTAPTDHNCRHNSLRITQTYVKVNQEEWNCWGFEHRTQHISSANRRRPVGAHHLVLRAATTKDPNWLSDQGAKEYLLIKLGRHYSCPL